MNTKGQALIEFILILPIFLMLMFGIIDFALILNCKNNLENKVLDISFMLRDDKTVEEIIEFINDNNSYTISLDVEEFDDKYSFIIKSQLTLVTPGLDFVLESPYNVEVSHNVYK